MSLTIQPKTSQLGAGNTVYFGRARPNGGGGGGLPAWRPAPGYFSDISNNTLTDVRPSSWGPASDISGPFINYGGGTFAPDIGTYGALIYNSSGHLSPTSVQWSGVWRNELDTGLWQGSNLPPQPFIESTTLDQYGIAASGPNVGWKYTPHCYATSIYQSPAMGGGPKGSVLQFFIPGNSSGWLNSVHRQDLSQPNGAPTRVIDAMTVGGATIGSYAMTALDEPRGGFWVTANNGNGPMNFVKFSDWSVTQYPLAQFNAAQGFALIKLPAPYDCLVAIGRTVASATTIEIRVFPIIGNAPQVPVLVTQSGVAPNALDEYGAPAQTCCGGVWSEILNCIVTYPGFRSPKVWRLQPPVPASLTSGTWAWTSETMVGDKGQVPSSPGVNPNSGLSYPENGSWSSFRECVAARCFIWCKGVNAPVQAFTLQGM